MQPLEPADGYKIVASDEAQYINDREEDEVYPLNHYLDSGEAVVHKNGELTVLPDPRSGTRYLTVCEGVSLHSLDEKPGNQK